METKYCKGCNRTLPKTSFTKNNARYDKLQHACRECMKIYRREHYRRNTQAHLDRNRLTKCRLKQYVIEYKADNNCTDCGISYPDEPWLMEFDHLDASEKLGGIAEIIRKYQSWKRLYEEIAKCELVCVICHRRRTAKRGNWKGQYLDPELDSDYERPTEIIE